MTKKKVVKKKPSGTRQPVNKPSNAQKRAVQQYNQSIRKPQNQPPREQYREQYREQPRGQYMEQNEPYREQPRRQPQNQQRKQYNKQQNQPRVEKNNQNNKTAQYVQDPLRKPKQEPKHAQANNNVRQSANNKGKNKDKSKSKKPKHTEQPKGKLSKKELFKKVEYTTLDLIPYKSMMIEGGFELDNGEYCNIYRISMQDYGSQEETELELQASCWDRFYLSFEYDFQIIGLNLPIDTSQQQEFLQKRLARTTKPIYRERLKESILELQNLKGIYAKQNYLFIYTPAQSKLFTANSRVQNSLVYNNLVTEMTPDEKIRILHKLYNPA